MADAEVDIDKIASLIGGEDAEAEEEQDGAEDQADEEGQESPPQEGEEEVEGEGGPSFMPDLLSGKEEPPPQSIKHKKSMLDTATAVSVVSLLKQELHKIGCTLKDYRIEFTVNGVDINNITVGTDNVEELRSKVGDLDDDEKARVASKVTTLAMIAVNDALKERVKQDLGLNISLFEYDNADMGAASLGLPEPEDPIQDIANTIDIEQPMGGMGGPEMGAEPEMPVDPGLEGAPDMGAPPPGGLPDAGMPPPGPEAGAPPGGAPAPAPAAPAAAPAPAAPPV